MGIEKIKRYNHRNRWCKNDTVVAKFQKINSKYDRKKIFHVRFPSYFIIFIIVGELRYCVITSKNNSDDCRRSHDTDISSNFLQYYTIYKHIHINIYQYIQYAHVRYACADQNISFDDDKIRISTYTENRNAFRIMADIVVISISNTVKLKRINQAQVLCPHRYQNIHTCTYTCITCIDDNPPLSFLRQLSFSHLPRCALSI